MGNSETEQANTHLRLEELAQLAVNANYLERSCSFFEGELATDDQLVGTDLVQRSDHGDEAVAKKEKEKEKDGSHGDDIPKMHSAREALKSVMSVCVDALFERLGLCVEHILERYTASVNWQSDKINNNIHEWVYKLLAFLDDALIHKNVKFLPAQYRDSAFFIAMGRIKQCVMTLFLERTSMSKWNIISMYNFNLDIIRLETYSRQTLIADLHTIFLPLRQLIDLLLSGKEITLFLTDEMRLERYPQVQVEHVRVMLEKYKTLGFLNKLPKHIRNLERKTVQTMLKGLRDME